MTTAVLDVRGLGHTYGSGAKTSEALRSLDFSVQPGELVSIVGPSGCGKTTLLRCVSGLMSPTRGEVRVEEEIVSGVPRELAMVFQDYSRSLYPWMSVAGNVQFPLDGLGLSQSEKDARVHECLHAVGLDQHHSKYPWQLSGGMQQRAAIARALAYRPEILLMDEPFASVDAQTRNDLEDLVLKVREQFSMTILFVTHDIDESVYLSDRVVVLSSPPTVVQEEVVIDLGKGRDQIKTRARPEFAKLRTQIAGLIHSNPLQRA